MNKRYIIKVLIALLFFTLPQQIKANTPVIDIIFVLDTSGSLNNEADSLQSAIENIKTSLESNPNFDIKFKTFAIYPMYDYYCGICEGSVYELFSNSSIDQYEDWGPAIVDLINMYTEWSADSIKVIVPVSDEGPENGDPVDIADEEIARLVAQLAEDNNIYIIPVLGEGAGSDIENLATIMAGKIGKVLKTTDGTFTPEKMEEIIKQIIAEAYGGYVFLNSWDVVVLLKGVMIAVHDASGAEGYEYEIVDSNNNLVVRESSNQSYIFVELPNTLSGTITVKINAYGRDFDGNTIESGWQEKTIDFYPANEANQKNICDNISPQCSAYLYYAYANILPYDPATGEIKSISDSQKLVQEPVDVTTGNWIYHHTDFVAVTPGIPFILTRYYNSLSLRRGWFFSLEPSLDLVNLNNITVYWPGGSVDTFVRTEGLWKSPYSTDKLYSAEGYYIIEKINGIKYYFDSNGKIAKVLDKKGNGYIYEYSTNTVIVKDSLGNLLVTITKDLEGNIVSVEDPKGNSIIYTYDGSGNLISYTDRNGNVTTYEYGGNGLITKVIGPDGNVFVENEYDAEGRVISQKDGSGNVTLFAYEPIQGTPISATTVVTYPDGTVQTYKNLNILPKEVTIGDTTVSYEYDITNRLSVVVDPYGKEWKYERNSDGLVVRAIDPVGNVYGYAYDVNNNLISITDPNGKVITYIYDENSNLIKVTLPDGNSTTIEYNTQNLPVKIKDPLGNSVEYIYNNRGLVSSVKLPNGATYSYEYDELGNVVKVIDPLNRETAYTYDNEGILTKIVDPAGYETKFEYNAYGDLVKVTDPKDRTIQMEYNVDGLLTKIILPDGSTVERRYDALGRVIETKDELGKVTKFDYDEFGKLSRLTDPKGNVFSFIYDRVGNLIKIVDAKGNEVQTDYDELYRPFKFYDTYNKLISKVQYDSISLPVKVEDSIGRSLEFVYDSLYRLQESTLSGNIKAKAVYDALGRIVKVIDPKGYETFYQYDSIGNLIKETNPLGKEWKYQYDCIGRLVEFLDSNGNLTTYVYDNLDRVTKITLSSADGNQTKEVTYTYDEVGNVLSVTDDVGKIEYRYDINDRITERKDIFGNVVKYVYDAAGRLAKLIYPDGKAIEYSYDENDNLIKVKDWAGRETTFEYDANGNLEKVNYPNGAYTIYEYDDNDRLIAVKNYAKGEKLVTSNKLKRNDVGDIIHITKVDYVKPDLSKIKSIYFTYNEFNQIVASDEGEFTYDNNGNLLSYTHNGKKINLSYGLADRLIKAEIGADTYEYNYDAEGNRVGVTKNGETKHYLIDNVLGLSKPLAVMDGNNNILKYYIWTTNGLTYSVDKDEHVYVYFYDYKGNTNAVIDENNQLIAAYTYSAYGKILGSYEIAGFENSFKFAGKFGIMSDSDELYYIRVRYYSPDLARWTQPDILRGGIESPLSLNRYAYNEGDAVNFIDVTGMMREKLTYTKIGASSTASLIFYRNLRHKSVMSSSKLWKYRFKLLKYATISPPKNLDEFKGKRGWTGIVKSKKSVVWAGRLYKGARVMGNISGGLIFTMNMLENSSQQSSDETTIRILKMVQNSALDTLVDLNPATIGLKFGGLGAKKLGEYIDTPWYKVNYLLEHGAEISTDIINTSKSIIKTSINETENIVTNKASDALLDVYNPYKDNSTKGKVFQWIGNNFFK